MKASFFHQAHLNNWETYLLGLAGDSWQQSWDDVVLTAGNRRQADAFRLQLDFRQTHQMLPSQTRFHVVEDPDGARIGSGGATLNVLRELVVQDRKGGSDLPAELTRFFDERRVLILHSGGDSKRLPQHSAFGKVFAPIPRLLCSGRPSTLFDELFVALSGIPALMDRGIMIASGDVLLLFDHSQLELTRPGFTGIGIAAPAETGSHHGVYVPDEKGRVSAFLHKPSVAAMTSGGAINGDGDVTVDTGIVYFDAPTAAALGSRALAQGGWLDQAVAHNVALNFYGDFLLPLAPSTSREAYLADTSDGPATEPLQKIREGLWDALRGRAFFVESLSPAKFLHFGTVREYQRLITYDDDDVRALGGRRRISHIIGAGTVVDEQACLMQSRLGDRCRVAPGAVAEYSILPEGSELGRDSIASNLQLANPVCIPADTVVHGLPVLAGESGPAGYVVRMWGIDDNPKAGLEEEATYLGRPLTELLQTLGVTVEDVWPGSSNSAGCTLWSARLFPVAETVDAAWAWTAGLLDADGRGGRERRAWTEKWLSAERHSLQSSYECADLIQVAQARQDLFAELVWCKVHECFQQEKPVRKWFEKIPTQRDFARLFEGVDGRSEGFDDPLERIRFDFSLGTLLRNAPASCRLATPRPEPFEERAFKRLSKTMLAAEAEFAPRPCVQRWHRDSCDVSLASRIDFAGGWSDTPPYTLERGGTVLNAAVAIDGILPIRVFIERLEEPRLVVESRDLGVEATIGSAAELLDYRNPLDPLAIHKASLVYAVGGAAETWQDLSARLVALGGGIRLSSEVLLPKGTGLGTSSILAAALAKAVLKMGDAGGEDDDYALLFDAAASIEQMLTTGGGWQDQVGGLVPGIKIATSAPGLYQAITVEELAIDSRTRAELDERLVIIDTGQRRLAKNLLREIMGSWLAREAHTVRILDEIQRIARDMRRALKSGDLDEVGDLLWRHWETNKRLDRKTSNAFIDQLMAALRPHLAGAKLAGAGGGGFLFGVAKTASDVEAIRVILNSDFRHANVTFHESRIAW